LLMITGFSFNEKTLSHLLKFQRLDLGSINSKTGFYKISEQLGLFRGSNFNIS